VDREVMVPLLALALAGASLRFGPLWPVPSANTTRPFLSEQRCWRRVWLPLVPAAILVAAIAGWAVFEPDPSEILPASLVLLAVPFIGVCVRAVWRALGGRRRQATVASAGVVGLLRPEVVIAEEFRRSVDERALAAALAHEAAHARHRDPLRLWLAQVATDLQWPSRRAERRLRAWARMLEFARDDEARWTGIEGDDLAAAILTAVGQQQAASATPGLFGDVLDLEHRIRRLLRRPPPRARAPRSGWAFAIGAISVALTISLCGAEYGERLVHALCRVLP